MADDDFEEDAPDLDDDVELEDDIVEVEDDVELEIDDDVAVVFEEDEAVTTPAPATGRSKAKGDEAKGDEEEAETEEDDDGLDLEEELHPDDVEDPLDVLLKERTTAERMDDDEEALEDEEIEVDDRVGGSTKIIPRRDDEFLCRSCFLVKPLSQLAKGEKNLCRDCE